MLTFTIQSFGCRVNQAEGFEWAEVLQAQGLNLEKNFLLSDLIIVNSCALTRHAERDVRKFLRRVARLNPQAKLILTGCAVPFLKEELIKNRQVSLIIPNEEKEYLIQRLKEELLSGFILKEKESQSSSELQEELKEEVVCQDDVQRMSQKINLDETTLSHKDLMEEWEKIEEETEAISLKSFRSRALIKIQDGCSHHCTFCVIPHLRGPSRSRPPEKILERIKQLIDRGYKEIVLAGIHLTSYGEDHSSFSLRQLLEEATKIDHLGRLRLSSLDPRALSDDLIDFIAGHEKICQHFHLSLQHASEAILRRMGRQGSAEDYSRILSRLREKSPYASLGADFIVGFPGETEEDYLFLENFVASSPLTYLHVFPYSPRPMTPAACWPQLEDSLKKARARRLRALGRQKNFEFRQSLRNFVFDGIAINQKNKKETEVLTHNYLKVKIRERLKEGEQVAVRIEEVRPEETWGSIVFRWEK